MKIQISRSYDLSELAASWTALEPHANANFFLSWRWIGTWLRTTGMRPLLVRATDGDSILALGLLTPARRRRHFLSVNQLCLHETGMADFDAVTIEYNNFLVARHAPDAMAVEILRALQSRESDWDEIVLGGVPSHIVAMAEAAGLHVETDRSAPDFGVDLSAETGPGRWEDTLSANLRAQLRQSRALAVQAGPLRLTRAEDTRQALDFFEKMVVLHTAYWQGKNKPGAFATTFAQAFHRELIAFQSGSAHVDLLELAAGNQVMGYLYNFQYADRVYAYQSGFSYSADNRHRPGLVAHAMAIGQARDRGMGVYDFLAGDAHYKARLGRRMGTMLWCRAQRDEPRLKAERAVRKLYRRLRGVGA